MSLSLAFRFVAGRYHATPFGHHVNEGLIEWPPSPWRILRALISVGYTSGVWGKEGPSSAARSLIEKLSVELPSYRLPSALGAHSRHYMPIGTLNPQKTEKTTLVFDTWARVDDEEMVANWSDVHLREDESAVLNDLAQCLNYLGRSESWVACRMMSEGEQVPEVNCFPEERKEGPGRGWEQVLLLAPVGAADYAAWRAEQVHKALVDWPLPEGRKPSKKRRNQREKAVAPFPCDLLDCLQRNTNWWRSHGWSQPPGSRRVFYWRPARAVEVGAPKAKPSAPPTRRVKAMLVSLTNASRNDHALPPVTRTLPQADLLHRALVCVAAKAAGNGEAPPELTGRDQHRKPFRGPHGHAHVIPLDLDGDGHLDHILIWAPMGLGAKAQAAVRTVRKTFTKGGIEPLRLALAATGDLSDLTRLAGDYGKNIAAIAGPATIWQSATPFVPPRHLKPRGRNTLEGQIRAELHSRDLPQPMTVTLRAPARQSHGESARIGRDQEQWFHFRHYVLARQRGPTPPAALGFAIQLKFEREVAGPVALGYASHFGLGLFKRCATSHSRHSHR